MSQEIIPVETVELVHAERGTRITVAADAAETWSQMGYGLPDATPTDLDLEVEPDGAEGEPEEGEAEPAEAGEPEEVEAEPADEPDPEPAPAKRRAAGKRAKK